MNTAITKINEMIPRLQSDAEKIRNPRAAALLASVALDLSRGVIELRKPLDMDDIDRIVSIFRSMIKELEDGRNDMNPIDKTYLGNISHQLRRNTARHYGSICEGERAMKSIYFTADEITQILEGKKTQCRKVIKPNPIERKELLLIAENGELYFNDYFGMRRYIGIYIPFKIGDVLYCKETWRVEYKEFKSSDLAEYENRELKPLENEEVYQNCKSYDCLYGMWQKAITMPEWASRCKIRITGIRVERLQEMCNDDAEKEGLMWGDYKSKNWDSHNKVKWESNPWVWVYSFEVIK